MSPGEDERQDAPEGNGEEGEESTVSLVADEPPPDSELEEAHAGREKPTGLLALFALGIVYGDIGTSPLYALRESFHGSHSVDPASAANVLGVLSLIFWSLILVVSLKYLYYVLRAENSGEGGILALGALLDPWRRDRRAVALLTIFGAALLYGDGAITPAISVLAAVEGLRVAAPGMEGWILPLAVTILVLLFAFQKRGTTGVGAVFGPVMLIWFVTLAVLGVAGLVRDPSVLAAVNPLHAVRFFLTAGWDGFLVLGAVFLVVTGGEALYADLGHLGARPIRLGWFGLVLPALLLNYFGQAAVVLAGGPGAEDPFYALAPSWAALPLVGLATAATIIASQAVISGVFSLTRQAIQLGLVPELRVEQTSPEDIGRVYLPAVNWLMMAVTVGLAVGFGSSSNLAAAYGVAVSTTFVITTLLAYEVSREGWGWSPWLAVSLTGTFLVVDLAFLGANLYKIPGGGWFPLVVAGVITLLMTTWREGERLLRSRLGAEGCSVEELLARIEEERPPRVGGTGVFVTTRSDAVPPMLLHQLDRMGVLHETVLVLTPLTSNVPRVPFENRLEVREWGEGLYRAEAHHGFMQGVNVPVLVKACARLEVPVEDDDGITYYVGRERPVPVDELGMSRWRARIFSLMKRSAPGPESAYQLPLDKVVELGLRVEV